MRGRGGPVRIGPRKACPATPQRSAGQPGSTAGRAPRRGYGGQSSAAHRDPAAGADRRRASSANHTRMAARSLSGQPSADPLSSSAPSRTLTPSSSRSSRCRACSAVSPGLDLAAGELPHPGKVRGRRPPRHKDDQAWFGQGVQYCAAYNANESSHAFKSRGGPGLGDNERRPPSASTRNIGRACLVTRTMTHTSDFNLPHSPGTSSRERSRKADE